MLSFDPIANARPAPGLVLRVGEADPRYLRITHVFRNCVYAMWVGEPEKARYARRPKKILNKTLLTLAKRQGALWGRLALPIAMSTPPPKDSERARDLEASWALVRPLTEALERESNLSRTMLTELIRIQADSSGSSFITLRRMLLRYYYFGQTRLGLLPLPSGIKPGEGKASLPSDLADARPAKRRGRQSVLAQELGKNDFVVSEDDIADMIACLRSLLRKGATFVTHAHEDYLRLYFQRRHPDVYAQYLGKKRPEPVTARQFRYYLNHHARLEDDLAVNLRTAERHAGNLGALHATGPGELYEIDATGGRLYLVTNDKNPVIVGKPTIYLMIDRWSRYIVAIYLSLRAASYEEVRHALLIAFTSRERRFHALGVDVDDVRWPVGRVPAVLCPDRGSEFISDSMEQAVVHDLRIELTPLPPLCPDGKAIVERVIRELKRRMAASRMKGVYADRPLDPKTKRTARKAEAAAIHSLAEGYRVAVEFAVDHNNRPHSALKRRRVLTRAGIAPTPRDAYVWGLEHITGLRAPPLSEGDYQRLLLSTDKASLSSGVLRYRSRAYRPVNEEAVELATRSPIRARSMDVRLDRMNPEAIYIPTANRDWAEFRLTLGAARDLAAFTLDEEEAFSPHGRLLSARAENESRLERLSSKAKKRRPIERRSDAVKTTRETQQSAREDETRQLKRALIGESSPPALAPLPPKRTQSSPDWMQIEEEERRRNLDLIKKQRSSR